MRVFREVLAVVLIVGLLAFPVWAQVIPGSPFSSGGSGGGGVSFPLLAPDGSFAAPSYAFASEPGLGWYRSGAGILQATGSVSVFSPGHYYITTDGTSGNPAIYRSPDQGIFFPSSGGSSMVGGPAILGVGTGGENVIIFALAGGNLRLGVISADNWQFGGPATATGVAQILQGQNSTGSGTAGGALIVKGGAGTAGNADGGDLTIAGGASAGSGIKGNIIVDATQIKAMDGASTAPSYSFTNKTTAGMYISSAGAGGTFVRGPSGSGANQAGGFAVLDGGPGTGTGIGGGVFLRIAPPSTSSSTLNTVQDALSISGNDGSITFGLVDILGTPGNMSLQGPRRAGGVTDGAGGEAFNIFGSQGTGTGAGGDVRFFVAPPAAGSASTQNGNQEVFRASGTTGDITITPAIPGGGTRGSISLSGGATGGGLKLDRTVTAGGTTGAQTINKMAGCVNFAAAAATLVVTNSLATTTSIVLTTTHGNDGTCWVKDVERASGSFTIRMVAACTGETPVCFLLSN